MESGFELHPRLAQDTLAFAELDLCTVRLMNDSRFPWLILVPRRAGAREFHQLAVAERSVLMEEIAHVSAALERATGAVKINVGALGNIVAQLHVHVVARFESDAAWPGPVWGSGPACAYDAATRLELVKSLAGAGLQPLA